METITVAGVILFVLSLAVKELFGWFRQRNLQNSEERLRSLEGKIESLSQGQALFQESRRKSDERIRELHEWHDRRDADGVPVWYIRKSLEDIIKQNANAVTLLAQQGQIQTQLLKELTESQKSMHEAQKDILIEMRRLHTIPSQLVG